MKISGEKFRSGLRRGMWIFMALLFVISGVGISAAIFWQATRQPDDATNQANACQFDLVQNQPTVPTPEVFKPQGDITELSTVDLKEGDGAALKVGDCVTVKYYGTLAADGTMFDENFSQTQALKFRFGSGQTIPGWEEGLVGMKVGGQRRLVMPSELAYGSQSAGSIPANSDLVFVVNLLSAE